MKSLIRLKPYIKKHLVAILISLALLVLSNIFALIGPWILKHAVDSLKASPTSEKFAFYGGLILAIAIVQGITRYISRYLANRTARFIEYDLRNDLFAHLQTQAASYYTETRTGDLMSRATNDLNAVRMALGMSAMFAINTVIVFFSALAIMIKIDAPLTLFALLPFPILTLMVKELGKRVHDYYEKIQAQYSTMSNKVQENLAGVRVVKAYTLESTETEEFSRLNREYVERSRKLIKLETFFFPLIRFLPGLSGVVLLWLGGQHVISGKISLGDFVAFNSYLIMLIFPMVSLGFVINSLQRGAASMGRINELFDAPPEIKDESEAESMELMKDFEIRGEVEFKNLTFGYEPNEPILENINLRIPKGSIVAIVGAVGSGKSTLVNLIPRLYQAEAGMVLIDGVDVKKIPLKKLRASIGYIQQESFLFSDSIGANIAFGVESATENEIRGVAETAALLDDIDGFANGFQTQLGERGITISGGQKQRTSIARALLVNPKILILDDAFSSVDTHTEEQILTQLRSIMADRTSVIISHRASTVKDADLIVVLQDGQIIERGTHEELLALGGFYAELYEKQLLQQELEKM